MKRFFLISVVALAALFMTGCDLFVDRSATELAFEDAQEIDIKDLQKYDNLQKLDIRSADVSTDLFDQLQAALPNCQILWSVPIGGARFDSQITQITLPKVEGESLSLLDYFPNLADVDATACDCYGALMTKSLEMTNVAFHWNVTIGGVTLKNTDTAADLSGLTTGGAETLGEALSCLPGLTSADITDTDISSEDAQALIARFPNIAFLYTADIFGVKANSDATALDLTTAVITDESALADALAPLTALTAVDLSGQTLTFETMDALSERYPTIQFSFTVELFGQEVPSDAAELDLRGNTFTAPEEVSEGISHLPNLTYCDLCDTGLTNEQMETLMAQFPNVKFVWYVDIGAWRIRTDIEAFSTGNRDEFPNGAGYFTGKGRTSLTDTETEALKYCTDLVYLDLGHNKITSLTFLEGLTKLRVLIVGSNKIPDITSIAKLVNLEYLEMFMNLVTDISPLSGLTKLAYLNCSRNSFTDITPLLSMTQLKRLWIVNNRQISKDDFTKLIAALPDCEICTSAVHSTANGWRETDIYKEFQEKFGLPALD
ncbi:MAG: leucine-rich repeat domain-containing protein [Clostridiaceae bacterium]